MNYDVAIIGAGPAGATLARLLKPSLRVALIDKKSHDTDSFKKPCGGLLAPDAQTSLKRLRLEMPAELLAEPQIPVVKTIDLNSGLIRYYRRGYINIDRHKFDMWLVSLVPESVDTFMGSRCTKIRQDNNAYIIEFLHHGIEKKLETRCVIGADGAKSIVRQTFFEKVPKSFTSIQQWFKQDVEAFYTAVFDNDITESYAWGLPKDGYSIFGAALPAQNASQCFEKLKKKLVQYGYNYSTPVKTEACMVLRPETPSDMITGRGGVFLIGEAGCFISPSSLEGISYALDTAEMLADAINADLERAQEIYRRKAAAIKRKLMLKVLKMPFMYNKTMRKMVMKSGLTAIRDYN